MIGMFNPVAIGLYEKCGFKTIVKEQWFRDRPRIALLLKYSPTSEAGEVPVE